MDVFIRSNSNVTRDTANCRTFLNHVRIFVLIFPFLHPDGKSESATREQTALLDLLGVVIPFVLFRDGNGSIFAGRNRYVMCADDLGCNFPAYVVSSISATPAAFAERICIETSCEATFLICSTLCSRRYSFRETLIKSQNLTLRFNQRFLNLFKSIPIIRYI